MYTSASTLLSNNFSRFNWRPGTNKGRNQVTYYVTRTKINTTIDKSTSKMQRSTAHLPRNWPFSPTNPRPDPKRLPRRKLTHGAQEELVLCEPKITVKHKTKQFVLIKYPCTAILSEVNKDSGNLSRASFIFLRWIFNIEWCQRSIVKTVASLSIYLKEKWRDYCMLPSSPNLLKMGIRYSTCSDPCGHLRTLTPRLSAHSAVAWSDGMTSFEQLVFNGFTKEPLKRKPQI